MLLVSYRLDPTISASAFQGIIFSERARGIAVENHRVMEEVIFRAYLPHLHCHIRRRRMRKESMNHIFWKCEQRLYQVTSKYTLSV